LGIETSTPQTTVALGSEQGILAATLLSPGRSTHELVVGEIAHLLGRVQVPITSLAGIAVGLGPGLFTSMRVGIATAKTLAQALSAPIVEFASPAYSFPAATALVELAIPRFEREEFDRVFDVQPYYVRKSDAEIAWDHRRRAG